MGLMFLLVFLQQEVRQTTFCQLYQDMMGFTLPSAAIATPDQSQLRNRDRFTVCGGTRVQTLGLRGWEHLTLRGEETG